MKAALLEKLGELTVRELPDPIPGDYDCLCELLYGATCSGTDMHLISGRLNWAIDVAPSIIGHESVGRVLEVGAKVRNFKVGDLISRVGAPGLEGSHTATWGGFATRGIACDHVAMAEDGAGSGDTTNQLIPADFDPRICTMIITWRETFSYISRMGVGKGDRVLVIGSGGNGLSYATHAKNLGASEVVMIGNGERASFGEKIGVSAFLDYRADDLAEQLAAVKGDGFDFVIDAVGKVTMTDLALSALRSGGTLGIYGIDDMGKIRLDPGKGPGTFTFFEGGYDEAEAHDAVIAFIQDGKLDASLWMDLDDVYSLDDINDAFQAVVDRKHIKMLVKLSDG
jgi:threonine dehydrogenase-like Zn-dependent dehydrogenase